MRGRSKINLPAGWRLAALAGAAVVLPALVLSVIQYRSLAELREKTKFAVQENLRQSLQSVRRGAEESFVRVADEALSPFGPEDLKPANDARVESHSAEIRRRYPAVDKIFFVANCSCRAENFAVLSGPGRLKRVGDSEIEKDHDVRHLLRYYDIAGRAGTSPGPKDHDFVFWQEHSHEGHGEDDGCSLIYVFKPLVIQGEKAAFGFAGVTLKPDYVRQNFFKEFAGGAFAGVGEAGSDLIVGVFDDRGREILSSGGGGSYEVRAPLAPALPQWTAAAGYRGTTVEALAADNFRKGILLVALVLCCLALGLFLILRSAAREVRLAQAKSAFVSNVSHELKTPLALIRLFAETLELGRVKDPLKAREYYRIISHESGRLTQLIDNILDFSKIEAGGKQYEFARADVGRVVEEVVRSYEFQIRRAGFELELDAARDLPEVLIDRGALSQAVLNLLDNALKYSAGVKRIRVRVYHARAEGSVAVEVADRGVGIPRGEQEKIFEKFYRVGGGLVHDTKGSGLGLALVRHIVSAHRGRVTVESAPGRGSRFTIFIPAPPPGAAEAQAAPAAEGYRVAENPHH